MIVGNFEIEELTSGRWRVKNLRNGYEHVTYGTSDEVSSQAQLQTEAWERKDAGKKRIGSAWRNRVPQKAEK